MVSEEDCPLQECECAKLPHQVSPLFFPQMLILFMFCSFISLINSDSPFFPVGTLATSSLPHPPSIFGASLGSLVAQLEGRLGSVCSHPQTQTRPH